MISEIKKPHKKEDLLKILHPFVKEWFFSNFKDFSLPQLYAVNEIHKGNNILVTAPTGGTKTLTSTLSIINELVNLADQGRLENRTYCLYVNPLKSLSYDLEVNLKKPLEGIKEIAKKKGKKIDIRIGVRTGDTTVAERSKMLRKPCHILILTPETLSIVLTTTKFREHLKKVGVVILDEIHSLAESKRGVHLSLSLERLRHLTNEDFLRIGLSATIAPINDMARFLVGNNRKCKIADVRFDKKMDMKVLSPVKDMINTTYVEQNNSMYNLMDNLIQEHRTTLIFTNTRAATERVVHHLKEKFPRKYTENIGAHHGSLSKELRRNIENRMRKGELKVIVSSTSLELGIDIGYIDLVILLGSPKSISRCLQRIGRSHHQLHGSPKGKIIVLDRDDLIECSVMVKNALDRKIDRIHIPRNCLDVLAQQIYGIAISDILHVKDLYKLIKKSYCYKDLKDRDFFEVLDYLSGEYTKLEDRYIYAKIWYDKETGMIGKKGKMARVMYMTNSGTIPDESFVIVKVGQEVIGHIDEGFLERLKRGDVFVLGGTRYEFLYSKGMVAFVNASVYRPPTIPAWFSEMLPLNFDLASSINLFRENMEVLFKKKSSKKKILEYINSYLYVDKNAIEAIYNYFKEQFFYIGEVPNARKLLIEHYKEENKNFIVFHSLYGRRVNDVLSRAVAYSIGRLQHKDVEIGISDNGFYLASESILNGSKAFSLIKSDELNDVMKLAIDRTEVLKRRFRHCAMRALMILRNYKGRTKRVGRQQVSSMILLNAVRQLSENFSILKEARREVLEDLMDIENAKLVLQDIESGKIKIREVTTNIPSPFAFNLVLQGYVDVLKVEDKVEFLRRMHQMVLAKIGKKKRI
ncbi:ATP-dependent helicase [archaeon]|nr:ATP-dependent helicase [archaeon]|tara:strand:+ start:6837 stop:9428 length:2592 start_codon:yes stop_codon:yes gene_type:complete